jgi:formylmethanofuran dehydrogenase subunit E-like metal-binding protein
LEVFSRREGVRKTPACLPRGEEGERQMSEGDTKEVLVWRRDTWGSLGQHDNVMTFVLDEDMKFKPIFDAKFGVTVRHVNKDSRKNVHRYTYVSVEELKKLAGRILKVVHDYASSSKREVTVRYYVVTESGELRQLEAQTLRDVKGFFDVVDLGNGQRLVVRKDTAEFSGETGSEVR